MDSGGVLLRYRHGADRLFRIVVKATMALLAGPWSNPDLSCRLILGRRLLLSDAHVPAALDFPSRGVIAASARRFNRSW